LTGETLTKPLEKNNLLHFKGNIRGIHVMASEWITLFSSIRSTFSSCFCHKIFSVMEGIKWYCCSPIKKKNLQSAKFQLWKNILHCWVVYAKEWM